MIDVERVVNEIGLDIDGNDSEFLKLVQRNASEYGFIRTTKSKKGNHIDVELKKPISLKDSLWLRFRLHDDPLRILFDALRIINDIDNLDVLWDDKQKKTINDIMREKKVVLT